MAFSGLSVRGAWVCTFCDQVCQTAAMSLSQNTFTAGAATGPRWESLQRSPRPPNCIGGRRRERNGREGKVRTGKGEEEGRGEDGRAGHGRGREEGKEWVKFTP